MRKATKSITFKLTPGELEIILEAVSLSKDAWMGKSFHVRHAALSWARGMVGAAKAARIQAAVQAHDVRVAGELLRGARR